jgi:uncharacterized protein YjdB
MKRLNALRALGALALSLVLSGFLAACSEPFQPSVRGITISISPDTLNVSETATLTVKVDAPSSVDSSITLSIENKKIKFNITSDDNEYHGGVLDYDDEDEENINFDYKATVLRTSFLTISVKALLSGTDTITATANPGGKTATCEVTVN